jgi:hypothetical protein
LKRFLILSLALAAAAAAFADNTPAIDAIFPSTSPTTGGVSVTINGRNFSTTVQCLVPCPTTVGFGDVRVVPDRTTDTQIVVKAPAHPAGIVDVNVTTGGGRSASVPNAFTFTDSALDAEWEPVLVPVYIEGEVPGSGGSLWKTDLWVENDGAKNLVIAPWPCPGDQVCLTLFPLTKVLQPGEGLHGLGAFSRIPSPIPGRLFYFARDSSDRASMNLRVWDASRGTLDAGTEVPVIRGRELLSQKVSLLNIPIANNRLLLRVYDVALADAAFHVRVLWQTEDANQQPFTEFDLRARTSDTGPLPTAPAYAQADIPVPLVGAANLSARVEVTPLTAGSRYWTFVSVTNQTTSHVTTVTPQ